MEEEIIENKKSNYDKIYKVLLVIPLVVLIFSLFYLFSFYAKNNDIIYKDVSLTGGTTIRVNSDTDIGLLREALEKTFGEVNIRKISDLRTGRQVAFIIETTTEPDEIKSFLEDYLGFKLTNENHSIEFTGSTLSESFYAQLRLAIILAFIFMAIVVFIIFRTFVPSFAVILSAFSDIVMTITIINLLGIRISTAGIVAILMLIGYSVDTDIMLTARILKRREQNVNKRIFSALKTGLTMTLTSLVVVIIGLVLTTSFSKIFSQIFTVLTIGLIFDIFNTWFTNASLLKWYTQKKKLD